MIPQVLTRNIKRENEWYKCLLEILEKKSNSTSAYKKYQKRKRMVQVLDRNIRRENEQYKCLIEILEEKTNSTSA